MCVVVSVFFAGSGSTRWVASFPQLAPGSLYVPSLWRHCVALETGVAAARSQRDDWDN